MVVPFIVSPEIVPATVNFAFGVDVPIPTLPVNPLLDMFPVVLADQYTFVSPPPEFAAQLATPFASEVNI